MQSATERQETPHDRAIRRERLARKRAEELLERKSLELYRANEELKAQYQKLQKRKTEIEQAHGELQATQGQLVHSEKMASVGQLAAGVAHEINNPVAFVKSNLGTLGGYFRNIKELLAIYDRLLVEVSSGDSGRISELCRQAKAAKEESDVEFLLEDIEDLIGESAEGAERVQGIVQGLKSFSRVDENAFKEADINEGIEATLKVVWNELKYKCEIVKELGDVPLIRCYAGQLNQVFMNLLVNASQAIEERGTVKIKTAVEDGNVLVEISDTGSGISPEHLSTIFDPFFTTKEVGSGTGLGLSISYGIVQKHSGAIEVDSELGRGTTFRILLPVKGADDDDST